MLISACITGIFPSFCAILIANCPIEHCGDCLGHLLKKLSGEVKIMLINYQSIATRVEMPYLRMILETLKINLELGELLGNGGLATSNA